MDVAGVEAERNRSAGLVEDARVRLDRPVSGERPLIEPQPIGSLTCEVLRLLGAEVGLGCFEVPPVGLSLEAVVGDGHQVVTDAVPAGLAQELLDGPLGLFVSTLAEVVVADSPLRVGDVHRRPVPVREGVPDRVLAVQRDRILDA
jgi:hypothetical protein